MRIVKTNLFEKNVLLFLVKRVTFLLKSWEPIFPCSYVFVAFSSLGTSLVVLFFYGYELLPSFPPPILSIVFFSEIHWIKWWWWYRVYQNFGPSKNSITYDAHARESVLISTTKFPTFFYAYTLGKNYLE